MKPHGFIVVGGLSYDSDELLSSHGSIDEAVATLPSRIVGDPSGFGRRHDWYDIIDVVTLKPVKEFFWKYDCSGAPVFWELRESAEKAAEEAA